MSQTEPTQVSSNPRRLPVILSIIFGILAIAAAVGAYSITKTLVSQWEMTSLPGAPVISNPDSSDPGNGTPGASASSPTDIPGLVDISSAPQPWDGTSRVNILVMGLDYEDTLERKNPRTDSMWLFTIDPLSMTAGMISIPRDLWVNIPGAGYGKINTAYSIGSGSQLPGGGSLKAAETVEQVLGVPIQFTAQIDFAAFVKFIDDINCITLDIKQEIKVDPLGQYNTKILKPGTQRLCGDIALGYARNRHTDGGDFDRSSRQFEVIMAVRNRVTKPSVFPYLLTNVNKLYGDVSAGVHTNMTLQQAVQLGLLLQKIDPANIKHAIIGSGEVTFVKTVQGDSLKPITDKIRILRDEIFTTGGPLSPASLGNSDPGGLMKAEAAKVGIQNGSYKSGLAGLTHDYLQTLGVDVQPPADSSNRTSATMIYDYTGKPYTVKFLADLMHVHTNQIVSKYDPNAQPDVVVVLGDDWANTNSLP